MFSPRSILVFSGRYHIISTASIVNNCIILHRHVCVMYLLINPTFDTVNEIVLLIRISDLLCASNSLKILVFLDTFCGSGISLFMVFYYTLFPLFFKVFINIHEYVN